MILTTKKKLDTIDLDIIEWVNDGNVIKLKDGFFTTQCTQYCNRLKGYRELRKYFIKEYCN